MIGLPNAVRSLAYCDGVVGGALRDADRLRGRAEPGALERAERDAHPLPDLADHVLRPERARPRSTGWPVGEPWMPILCSNFGTEKPVAVLLDDEGRDALVLAIGHGEDDVEVGDAGVRDPVLGAVDDPARRRPGRALVRSADGVRARIGLREREGGRPLAARALRQESLLQLVGAEELDRQGAELLDHQDQGDRRRRLGQLLDGHLQHQRAGAGAAVLGVERQTEDVLVGEQLAQVLRVLVLLVDLGRARRDLLLGDLANEVAEVLLLLGDVVDVGHGRAGY